ncbi:preprotein translocase subunit SecD [Natrarchaeobaculum aegyptiacum]|uniref:Protein-export membrane protein SecD n=1 Tax=Natrarchaeobaculum aegyptiacum TaxID=745377 RepID=A0A2Z2HQA7_9EURY|nr:preprotein translocase subunit SecD [Natrarchaeobaculum aegyptiacum]ARS89271.1 preprotein translocase subunit SecD [Natrarchaeobaculum aegyptiacum]
MGPKAFVKEYWRILVLVLFVGAALFALFVPGGVFGDTTLVEGEDPEAEDTPTNLVYGLGLEGGSRISAPVAGMTADDVESVADAETGEVDHDRIQEIEAGLHEDLEPGAANLSVVLHDDGWISVEIYDDDTTEAEFAEALNNQGLEVDEDDVRPGVTAETRAAIIETIQTMINEAGLSGGTAYEQQDPLGGSYVVTEVPDMGPDQLEELLSDRGVVEVWAYYPDGNGSHTNETVLSGDDITDVDPPQPDQQGPGYVVPVQVSEDAAWDYQDRMNELQFTSVGQHQCGLGYDEDGTVDFDHSDDQDRYCLITVADGEPVAAHSMGPDLASSMSQGTWAESPTFQMGSQNIEQANSLAVSLRAGALPAPLDFTQSQTYSIQPALADQFKFYSLLIGALSILTVAGMVFLRYRNPKVAVPMILTASTEVVILLGFAALIKMPLDLSHVAGFIAVVGTGVDDLVIIADEVMDDGDVSSSRVFESRFRKAFWIIGAAAATTIIALSPLAVLSLGDLRGFAIITILGVLIGVLITRPAYGDILQRLLTDR